MLKNIQNYFVIFLFLILLDGCATQGEIKLGMTVPQVEKQLGKPLRKSEHISFQEEKIEDLVYHETVWDDRAWSWTRKINTLVLTFKNGKLAQISDSRPVKKV